MKPILKKSHFGFTPDGSEIHTFSLQIPGKIEARVTNFGATWTHLFIPDREGKMDDVLLGFDSLSGFYDKEYLDQYCYIGSTVGRIAGRISGNKFSLDGKVYELPTNKPDTHLHGGMEGWDRKVWSSNILESVEKVSVEFSYKSSDGEENYPGTVNIQVTYTLWASGKLEINYKATTDQKTILNPTNHFYINLNSDHGQDIEDHELKLESDFYLPVNSKSLPTGEILKVEGTVFDFRKPKPLKEVFSKESEQLGLAGGIDHCFVAKKPDNCANLYHPKSGRRLLLSTTAPGIQVYTGNYLNQGFEGKKGLRYGKRSGICLETQHFPDAVNQPHFPSVILKPDEIFESKTSFVFQIY